MNSRGRLPNRRALETVAFDLAGQRFKVGFGQELIAPGVLAPIREVFLGAQKPNSSLDCLASDGAILLSLLLQFGCDAKTIAHAMRREADGSPSSPLGFAADFIRAHGALDD